MLICFVAPGPAQDLEHSHQLRLDELCSGEGKDQEGFIKKIELGVKVKKEFSRFTGGEEVVGVGGRSQRRISEQRN